MQLSIKDKQRKLQWGLGALENLCNTLNLSLNDIDLAIMNNDTAVINRLTYCALENGAEIEDDTLDFNYKQFLAWLDEQPEQVGNDIANDFLKSKLLGKTMEERYNEIIARLNASETEATTPKKKPKRTPSEK